jgi:death on curing protein
MAYCRDGNKRGGLVAMLAFAGLNGLRIEADEDEMVDLVVGVAEGRTSKAEIAVFVKHHSRRLRRKRRRRTDQRGK